MKHEYTIKISRAMAITLSVLFGLVLASMVFI